jgi:hypothetical protein
MRIGTVLLLAVLYWYGGRVSVPYWYGGRVSVHRLAQTVDPRPGGPFAAFAVGALRRDGVIIPFAAYDGKRWSNRWPPPQLEQTVPINVRSVPLRWWGPTGPLDVWQAWTVGAPRAIRVVQPDWVDVHCVRQVGLRTDYRADQLPPPSTEQPYPKDGLVVSPPQLLERVDVLAPLATELSKLSNVLREAFNRAERETASRFHHPVEQKFRERFDPEIEAAYAFGAHPRVYYVETSRVYRFGVSRSSGTSNCTVAFGTGWFAHDGEVFRALAMTVDVLGCDKYGATYMLPFGVMRLAGKLFWLAQFSGWDHERFVVVEVKPKDVDAVVSAWGGGC